VGRVGLSEVPSEESEFLLVTKTSVRDGCADHATKRTLMM